MKKLIALLLVLVLMLTAFVACSPDDTPDGTTPGGGNGNEDNPLLPGNADPMVPDVEWSDGLL